VGEIRSLSVYALFLKVGRYLKPPVQDELELAREAGTKLTFISRS
jgi:hypothetical protein